MKPATGIESLTNPQRRVFDYIHDRIVNTGVPPTFRELRINLGYQSVNSIRQYLAILERKQVIFRDEGPRGIRLADPPKPVTLPYRGECT